MLGLCDNQRDQQWSGKGAGLVHELVQAETPASADYFGSLRKHDVARRRPKAFSGTLGDDQCRCHSPVMRERHERDYQQIDDVADQRSASNTGESCRRQRRQPAAKRSRSVHQRPIRSRLRPPRLPAFREMGR